MKTTEYLLLIQTNVIIVAETRYYELYKDYHYSKAIAKS